MALHYALQGDITSATYVDLGLDINGYSLLGQSINVTGSKGNNSFYLRPGGYSFNFGEEGGGNNTVYLTQNRSSYTFNRDSQDPNILVTRATLPAEEVSLRISSNMTLVFADGAATTFDLDQDAAVALDDTHTSVVPQVPDAASLGGGKVRLAIIDSNGSQTVQGFRDAEFVSFGNGNVDHVYVTAGSNVTATQLGAGTDRVLMEGKLNDYEITIDRSQLEFTRTFINSFAATESESIRVSAGLGGSNDRLVFADGAVHSRVALVKLRELIAANPDTKKLSIADLDVDFDTAETSGSSAIALESGGALNLTDTGASSDFVTSGGYEVDGVVSGFDWQYSSDGGQSWQTVSDGTRAFTLPGSTLGTTYAAGMVQARQVNPFGVASEAIANTQAVTMDTGADAVAINPLGHLAPLQSAVRGPKNPTVLSGGMTGTVGTYAPAPSIDTGAGLTLQGWVYIDSAAITDSNTKQFTIAALSGGGNTGPHLYLRNQKLRYYAGDRSLDTNITVQEGWNFFSISRENNGANVSTPHPPALTTIDWYSGSVDSWRQSTVNDTVGWFNSAYSIQLDRPSTLADHAGFKYSDISLWNEVRTDRDADRNASVSISGSEPGLIGHWSMDDNITANAATNSKTGGVALSLSQGAQLGFNNPKLTGEVVAASTDTVATSHLDTTVSFDEAAYTIQFWVYVDDANDPTGTHVLYSTGDDGLTFSLVSGDLWGFSNAVGSDPNQMLAAGKIEAGWNFISISRSGNSLSGAVVNTGNPDGHPLLTKTTSATFDNAEDVDLRFGAKLDSGAGNATRGAFEFRDITVWNGVRTTAEVQHDSTAQYNGNEADMVGRWRLDGDGAYNLVAGGPQMTGTNVTFDVDDPAAGASKPLFAGAAPTEIRVTTPLPVFSGTGAEPLATVTVYHGYGPNDAVTNKVGDAVADASGSWTLVTPLAQQFTAGQYIIRAFQTDVAGNVSPLSSGGLIAVEGSADPDGAPLLVALSDSGEPGDGITNDRSPNISSATPLSANNLGAHTYALYRDGTKIAEVTGTGGNSDTAQGLTINHVQKTWTYVHEGPDLADGDHVYEFRNEDLGVTLQPLKVIIDSTLGTPTMTAPVVDPDADFPILIQSSTGDVIIRGTAQTDVRAIEVRWNDSVATDLKKNAEFNPISGDWSATFTQLELDTLADGDNLSVTVTVTDSAGNTASVESPPVSLELNNEAPLVTALGGTYTDLPIAQSLVAGTTLLNLADVFLSGSTEPTNTIFSDADVAGSTNSTLTYTAVAIEDVTNNEINLPNWLELTPQGELKVAADQSSPNILTSVKIKITATDGASQEVDHTMTVSVGNNLGLTFAALNEQNLDVRSDLVLVAGEDIAFNEGTYTITLAELDPATARFEGETDNGSLAIAVSVNAAGELTITSVMNGTKDLTVGHTASISIVGGNKLVIDPGVDLDLASSYTLDVPADLVESVADSTKTSIALNANPFMTVAPTEGGTVAQIWDAAANANEGAMQAGYTWYDGTSGVHFTNDTGLDVNLSAVDGIVVVGRDQDATTDGITLTGTSRTMIRGFSENDFIYIDDAMSAARNVVTVVNAPLDPVQDTVGAAQTVIQLATAAGQQGQAGVIVSFADRDGSGGETLAESQQNPIAYTQAELGTPGLDEYSFERLTGNAHSVISG